MEGTWVELENPPNDVISRVRFAPRSNNLLLSSWDSTLRLYDAESSLLRTKADSKTVILDCCFQNESVALSVGSDCCLRRYDFYSGSQSSARNHDDLATCVEYSEETGQAITAGLDKKIVFYDMRMESGKVEYSKIVDIEVQSMSLCGLYLIVAIGVNINIYDLRNLRGPVQTKESPTRYQIGCIRSFPNRTGYAVGSLEGRVALEPFDPSDAATMGCVFRCYPKSKDGRYHLVTVNDIAFHPCYGTFITGDDEGYAIIWDAQSRKRLFEFPRYPISVASLSYNHSGQLLAIGSSCTYQEANEIEAPPRVFIHRINENLVRPFSSRSSR